MAELFLLLIVFATLTVLLVTTVNLLRRRYAQAMRLLGYYAIGLAVYFAILVTVSLASPQRIVPMDADRCFDDWCIAVENVILEEELGNIKPDGVFYVIELKLSNHARGRAQRASSTAIHLMDDQGGLYNISPQGQTAFETQYGIIPPLTLTMEVGQSYVTYQVFDLSKDVGEVVLTVEHPVGLSPGLFVIGDENSLLHKPTIIPLPLTAPR